MAIYHFSAKMISRANGSSAVAAAAYRSAARLQDERLDRAHDFTNKAGVVHSEIMAPEDAPEGWRDRATLWNAVEAAEVRKDAQLAREIEFAIPQEMDQAQGVTLARDFVQSEFVDRGMVADLNVHWDRLADGSAKPHAHVMLTLRALASEQDGEVRFGSKVREWNQTKELLHWREAWSAHVNARMQALGLEARIDHRSFKDQGIALEPQNKIGPAGARRLDRGEAAERALEHRQIARRNGERIIADPAIALDAITHQQATFTTYDMARFAHRHSDDKEQFDRVVSAVRASPELVALGRDGQGRERFTSRQMLRVEQTLEASADRLAGGRRHDVGALSRNRALEAANARGLVLSDEQHAALRHVTGREGLSLVVGYAGSGKSAMLGVAKEAWEGAGYRVRGAALSGIAAENLESGSGVSSRTLASLEHGWAKGRDRLTRADILVIDEAGLVGSRQMQRVLGEAAGAGAKVVLVGDPEQLQAIEAGAVFRSLSERHGAVEITQIRRQREGWQRLATRQLATGRTEEALGAYQSAGMVQAHASSADARAAVIQGWAADRVQNPGASQLMLAYTRADVAALNTAARQQLMEDGGLAGGQRVATARGERMFARGDRVMFLKNERSLGVRNGTVGSVEGIGGGVMEVRLGDGRRVSVDLKAYTELEYGYATTIHKAQGVTVDRVQVLASSHMDRQAAYVALSRHRDAVQLHYGEDQFATHKDLVRTLGRDRPKDMALDYQRAPSRREPDNAAEKLTSSSGLKTPALERGVKDYAKVFAEIEALRDQGLRAPPELGRRFVGAHQALAAENPVTAQILNTALNRHSGLASEIASPGGMGKIVAAMRLESAALRDPEIRAQRFIETWTGLQARHDRLFRFADGDARKAVETRMGALAAGLAKDPAMQGVLDRRRRQLGIPERAGQSLVQQLTRSISLERGPER